MWFSLLSLTVALTIYLGFRWVFQAGRYKQQAKREEAIHEAVRKAVRHRDKLRNDRSFARQLRKRFTRK